MPLSSRVPELGALDVLLSVARLGSFGQAAREHGTSQSAVSSRISYMERLLGVALIDRSPRGSRLTATGVLVVTWAQDVVDAAASLDVGVRALRSEHGRQLRVIASMTIAEYLAPNWLATIRRESPAVAVSLALANSAAVAEAVLDGDADLGFVEGPLVPPGLKTSACWRTCPRWLIP